ncbi:DMT family transporter [Ruegeria lacuscaerulensis]|uniref:DMT family transporter n=1 Tax=Ruegeria lacuscaerulensis TaxID=55218 RepID=UPI00147E0FC9|nr:DMT family transporter [Ruegeria lacuscaerulensis]
MVSSEAQSSNGTWASITLVAGGMMWGLYWIPVRFFFDLGLTGPWPGIAMYTSALLVLVPLIWRDRQTLALQWRDLVFSGMFTGAAFSLYSISLVYTDVVRSILLFYLTPIWGTLLGVLFLGERLSLGRMAALVCGLGGLFVVLGDANFVPLPQNIGDWLALASGICWALGTLGLYRAADISVSGQVFAFVMGAMFLSLVGLAFLPGPVLPSVAQSDYLWVLQFVLLSALYVLPMIYMTIWPATKLSPARVGLLLMSEVVVGIASAAALAGEPFGLRELLGALLIVSAAVLEIVRS